MVTEKEWLAEDGVDDAGTISIQTVRLVRKQFIPLGISKLTECSSLSLN